MNGARKRAKLIASERIAKVASVNNLLGTHFGRAWSRDGRGYVNSLAQILCWKRDG